MEVPAAREPDANGSSNVAIGPFPELDDASIANLGSGLRGGTFSIRELVERYLERIEALDRRGPAPPQRDRDQSRKRSKSRTPSTTSCGTRGPRAGPMHGIPVLLKDNIDTADQMLTTAGSLALINSRPQRDAFVVRRLREAGALLLGKTNMSEWANFRSSRSSSGWSARGGQCRNPYLLGCLTLRLQLRLGCRRRRGPGRRGGWDRDRRLDRLPRLRQLGRRYQTDAWSGQPGRSDPRRPQPGHGWSLRPERRRRGRAARGCWPVLTTAMRQP